MGGAACTGSTSSSTTDHPLRISPAHREVCPCGTGTVISGPGAFEYKSLDPVDARWIKAGY